jgi:hypothetical protein
MKPKFLMYDWKETPVQVLEDLKPVLRKVGIYLLDDPNCIDGDTVGIIITDNKNLTVVEYLKLQRTEFGEDGEKEILDLMKQHNINPTDKLQKLIDKMS